MHDFLENLLALPATKIIDYKITDEAVYIRVESTHTQIPCRKCGRNTKPKGLGQETKLRHLSILGKPCYLLIQPKRGICEFCDDNPRTNQRLEWYDYISRYTKAYENHILFALVNSTVSDVSIKENLGYDAIDGILQRKVNGEVDWKHIKKTWIIRFG